VALEPANNEKRTRMAQLAEWAGKQDIALEQWLWLAREPSGSEARANAMRLALGKEDDALWLALAGPVFQARPMKPEESAVLVAIEQRGRAPKQLVAFLQNYAKRHPLQRAQWETLANAQEQQGDLPAAIASWRAMSPQLISPPESARRQAGLLLRAQRPDEAWAALQEARAGAAPSEEAYWQAYGDAAWARESKPEALLAYRTVWEGGSSNALAIERLIALYNASAQPEQAIAVGRQAYERLAEARWLLLAMDAASQASRWEASRELSRLAQRDEVKFAGSEMYWLLEANIASHDGRKVRARKAYMQALALNPAAVPTRVQLLWFEHDYGDAQQLGEHVAKWQSDAQAEPAYWPVYSVALLKLNRVDESLAWFEKQAAAKPDDYVWQVGYFDALADAGGGDAAQRLRAGMMPRLRARLGAAGKTAKPSEKTLWLAYASMVRHFEGEPAGDQVLQDMLARGHTDADVYALLVGSSLAQEKFDKARYWLVRAEADQHKLPAYQSLAVALAQDDRQAIDRILQLQEKDLTPADRVTALRRLGRNVLALSLTEKSLLEADDASSERLRQHREQLRAQLARRIEAGYEARNLSDLKIKRSEVAVSLPLEAGRATLRLAHNALDPEAGGVLLHSKSLDENDISVLAEVAVGANPLRLTLGRNQRDEHSLTYGRLELTHALTKRWNARLDVAINGLTEETSALRAIGSKDKVAVGLNGSLSESVYARAELAGQRFNTRKGEKLGQGARLEGEIGTQLSGGSPAWQLRLSGSTERNRLVDSLPASLQPLAASPAQAVEGILSSRFSTLGIGATLRTGQGEGMERRLQGVVDGWVGRQWPANEQAYSLRAGMRLPVASAGQVRFEAFYTNVQGGVSSQANRGVGVWYRHEF
jgi:tetratricopeptide (TPR) repeat protein